ncbi:MAG: Gfo/Idh/MocA family oxidoreductase [Xanthomonadales bacterium]|jgi:predicted dehydrogenase|nr:Gfo/Idh/MocA family oxidoreductase [Xanthomonadales bacterium]
MNDNRQSRRDFIRKTTAATAGLSLAMSSAASYARILGANDRINLSCAGMRNRGMGLLESAFKSAGSQMHVDSICDVDSRELADKSAQLAALTGHGPHVEKDFRKILESRDIDAVVIATPDHLHAPFAIMAMQAGKHVYVEKPCSHNPREGELLAEVAKRYGTVVQMGNQQRSAPTSIQAVQDIRDGIIGRPYMGKAWYSNNRGSIGFGKVVPVPDWLDWDLWQGPAPRRDYKDNLVHYNWHWFWHWGTGEINNNALHELDICRWALGVGYPNRVKSSGGRYHFDDDWEFYDTQIASYEYDDDKLIAWEGRSCNRFRFFDRGRGSTIHGTEGTILLDRNAYILYDLDGKEVRRMDEQAPSETTNIRGAGALVEYHFDNFFAAIRDGEALHSPIDEGALSTTMCHLGNIAQKYDRTLNIDPATGHILGDDEAMSMWSREYEKGWSPEF